MSASWLPRRLLSFVSAIAALTLIGCGLQPLECTGKPPDPNHKCCCSDGAKLYWIGCSPAELAKCPGGTTNEADAHCACEDTTAISANGVRGPTYALAAGRVGEANQTCMAACNAGAATCLVLRRLDVTRRTQLSRLLRTTRKPQPVTITSEHLGSLFGIPASDQSLKYRHDTTISNGVITNVGEPSKLRIDIGRETATLLIPAMLSGRFDTTQDLTTVTFADSSMAEIHFSESGWQQAFGGKMVQIEADDRRLVATTEHACFEIPLVQLSRTDAVARMNRARNYVDSIQKATREDGQSK